MGTSDTAIIKARQCLLKAVKALENGEKLPALDPSTHRIRSASVLLPKGVPFQEGAKEALELREKDFEAV